MNQRNAIPANGTSSTATRTCFEWLLSHSPDSCGSAGTEARRRTTIATSRTENSIPAIAAAFGVRSSARVNERSDCPRGKLRKLSAGTSRPISRYTAGGIVLLSRAHQFLDRLHDGHLRVRNTKISQLLVLGRQ